MSNGNQSDLLGKKIFFLHPSAVIQNEIVFELIQQEFEAYIIRDQNGVIRLLKRYPDSLVFVNIDEGLSEPDWEKWIRNVIADPALADIKVGIVSAKNDEALMRKYIASVKIQGGYTVIKSDINKAVRQLLEILHVFDAKGRRRFLRATSENETLTTINIPHNNTYVNGVIKDISSTGLSCSFSEDPKLEKNSLCQDIQIKLQSVLLKLEGIVFGSRMDGLNKIYVVVFTQRIDPSVRVKIRKYIQGNIQAIIDAELKSFS
ncbi:MAG: PilZ domain-containing protein [Treponema sp.]|nr:PilZ domain-containing protein [Treponema sp.]